MQPGFFDHEDRLAKLEKLGDPLPRLDSIVDWKAFRPLLKVIQTVLPEASSGIFIGRRIPWASGQ